MIERTEFAAQLADFGLAGRLFDSDSAKITSRQSTNPHEAPEQAAPCICRGLHARTRSSAERKMIEKRRSG
jgi:hypothetical protein